MSATYQHSVGIEISITLPSWALNTVDASLTAKLVKPDGSTLFKDDTDVIQTNWPVVVYTTKHGELDQVGLYKWALTLRYTGKEFPLDPIQFRIWPQDREGS